jgi:hypothetical protein
VRRFQSQRLLFRILAALSVAAGAAYVATGCGNGSPPPIITPTPSAQSLIGPLTPGVGITGNCAAAQPTFPATCSQCFNGVMTSVGNAAICEFQQEVLVTPSGNLVPGGLALPILEPQAPAGPLAWPVYARLSFGSGVVPGNRAIAVKRGYKLSFSGSGRWDFSKNQDFGTLCRKNDLRGTREHESTVSGAHRRDSDNDNRVPVLNPENGLPEALYATDGTETFVLGDEMSERVVNNNGVLRIGFNVPPSGITYSCVEFDKLSFTISGCVDATLNAVACPGQ